MERRETWGQEVEQLCNASAMFLPLGKAGSDGEEDRWDFVAIASDESKDVDGDVILKKQLDITYLKERGYVNWGHNADPEYQIGFTKNAEILTDKRRKEIKKQIGIDLESTASLFVEGSLYKYVEKAGVVQKILRSGGQSLGVSIEGVMTKEKPPQAMVMGVALTHRPANMKTLTMLKSILTPLEKEKSKGMTREEVYRMVKETYPEYPELWDEIVAYIFLEEV